MTLTIAATSELGQKAREVSEALLDRGVPADVVPSPADEGAATAELLAGGADCALVGADTLRRLPAGLAIAAVLEREDPRDVLVPAHDRPLTLATLEPGARIGVRGVRRHGLLLAHRMDVLPVLQPDGAGAAELLGSRDLDAIVVSCAEARRSALFRRVSEFLDTQGWVPAPGQGVTLLLCRSDDARALESCAPLDDEPSHAAFLAESAAAVPHDAAARALGVLATAHGRWIRVWGTAVSPDGRRMVRGDVTGRAEAPEDTGRALSKLLVARGMDTIFTEGGA